MVRVTRRTIPPFIMQRNYQPVVVLLLLLTKARPPAKDGVPGFSYVCRARDTPPRSAGCELAADHNYCPPEPIVGSGDRGRGQSILHGTASDKSQIRDRRLAVGESYSNF